MWLVMVVLIRRGDGGGCLMLASTLIVAVMGGSLEVPECPVSLERMPYGRDELVLHLHLRHALLYLVFIGVKLVSAFLLHMLHFSRHYCDSLSIEKLKLIISLIILIMRKNLRSFNIKE